MTQYWWIVIPISVVVAFALTMYQGRKTNTLRFKLKQFGNAMFYIAVLVWVMFLVVWAVVLTPPIINLVGGLTPKLSPENLWIAKALPIVYIISIFIVAIWIMFKGFGFTPLKYSEEEKVVLNKDAEATRARFRRLFRLKQKGGEK